MKYERVTERAENGKPYFDGCLHCDLESDCGLCHYWGSGLNRLAELEDKIENGTLKEEKTCVYDECNDGDWHYWECSNCGDAFNFSNEFTPEENHYYYCPNCGARITEYKELQND